MKSRLLKVAKYLSSQGMYEEAAQIKKIAGYEEDRAAGWHPYDDWHEPRYQNPAPIQTAEALKAIYDAQTRSEAKRIAAGARESMEQQWAKDRAQLAKMEAAIQDLPDDAIEDLASDGKKLARLNRKASQFKKFAQGITKEMLEGMIYEVSNGISITKSQSDTIDKLKEIYIEREEEYLGRARAAEGIEMKWANLCSSAAVETRMKLGRQDSVKSLDKWVEIADAYISNIEDRVINDAKPGQKLVELARPGDQPPRFEDWTWGDYSGKEYDPSSVRPSTRMRRRGY